MVIAGCRLATVGPRVAQSPLAVRPAGALVDVWARSGGAVDGELVEMSDSGFIVLASDRLAYVPMQNVRTASVQGAGNPRFDPGKRDSAQTRWWRARSRFPVGVSDAQIAALLHHHGFGRMEVVR